LREDKVDDKLLSLYKVRKKTSAPVVGKTQVGVEVTMYVEYSLLK
jgi:hypothetical protein